MSEWDLSMVFWGKIASLLMCVNISAYTDYFYCIRIKLRYVPSVIFLLVFSSSVFVLCTSL